MTGISQAHSVVQPSPLSRRVAGVIVILYAVITMVPLAWIFLTGFK
jgi:multiple sugar transport system permease protein